MAHVSDPAFCTLHALRIKGFATAEVLREMTNQLADAVEAHLVAYREQELVQYREARGLWQLTGDGREAHAAALSAEIDGTEVLAGLHAGYEHFLQLNESFKALCGDWQLRDGSPNDHGDAAYDSDVIARLTLLNDEAQPVVAGFGDVLVRLAPYAPRLLGSLGRLGTGETKMFTGVMCGSFHDVWMELHEDLILTQGIDRVAEGSF
jgi:hypothetical protein